MDGSDAPTLEVGFAIDTGSSFSALNQLAAAMDSTEARIVREAQSIERATSGMLNLGNQTARLTAFASTTSAAFNKAEQAAERMTARLSEQAATFGMTRAAAAAWRAEQAGATSAADELRAAEAALNAVRDRAAAKTAAEAAAVRDASDAYRTFEAVAKQKTAAYQQQQAENAAAAAEAEAKAVRDAADAYRLFNAVAKQKTAAYQQQQAENAAAAAEAEAKAVRDAADAYRLFNAVAKQKTAAYNDRQAAQLEREAAAARQAADEQARLAALVRGSHDAQEADAVAAERLRESTDAVYAATKRVNAQIAESTRLYHAGVTAPAEYARQQAVLNTRLIEETGALGVSARGHQAHASAAGLSRNAQLELTHVFKASAEQIAMGAPPLQILTTHLGQLGQIASMTEGGVKGLAVAVAGMVAPFMAVIGPLAVVAGVAFGAFKQFQSQVKDSGELTRYRDSLGLTHKEMLQLSDGVDKAGDKIAKLTDVTVTAGDVMAGLWETIKDNAGSGDFWDGLKDKAVSAFGKVLEAWNIASAGITAGIYGTFSAVKTVWSSFPAAFGDIFVQGANAALSALNKLVKAGVDLLNGFMATASAIPGVKLGQIRAPQFAMFDNPNAGAAAKAVKDIGAGFTDAYAAARKADTAFWKQVSDNAKKHAKDRMTEEANALKADRTPKAPKVDHNALNVEAVEAQIRNLYKLADAYGVSSAAALIAEAREKAESKAIKARADVEAAVAQQVRLSVAQRVADAAKSTAALNENAAIQEQVNARVAAGALPASQAAQALRDQIALQPLLAAQEAARLTGDAFGYAKATAGLASMTAAQQRDNAAKRDAQYLSQLGAGADELARLELEAKLIDATAAARTHALAVLKAEQEERRQGYTVTPLDSYVKQQAEIADKGQANTSAAAQLNEQLRLTATLADTIGDAFGKSFGTVGESIGSVIKTLGELGEKQAAIVARMKAGTLSQAGAVKETASLQINAYGDMLNAAQGFFKEGTAGYEAIAAAEKVYRVAQLAYSIAAILQNTTETATHVANSAAQATADGTAGIAAQAKLPFPANIAAMAATAAALVAAGIAVFGGHGGGGGHVDLGNTGTGTVLGDPSAKSDSIKNAINDLKGVNVLMLSSSRQMAASLKSIDSQIGSFAAQIVKNGDINASSGISTGFQSNTIGSILSAPAKLLSNIPIIGGVFSAIGNFISSLFGTRTDVTGSGLYGAPQTVGQIQASGYTGQSYSDIEKTHKFLGIVTGRSYSTQYGSLDPSLNNQFTLILQSFDKAIAAAAGPLGDATDAVQAKLDSFVVDIGKIDLKGLSGDEIEKKLEAVFGKLGDQMASYVYPEITRFQKVGEGALETLTRVASTLETVGASLDLLGQGARSMGIDAKLGLADQFDSLSDLTSAADAYFQAYYTSTEQAAAKTAQMGKVFDGLGLSMPSSIAAFRQLVEAQDLTTTAGQATYATLLKLAPAFADLQTVLTNTKSAADIASERLDLQRQLLELQGDTAAVRALDLAKVDASNQALQQQVWALQDAQDAAKAAQDLADAWKSVGDTLLDEIKRIRGLTDPAGDNSFASLMGQFNAATTAARSGDQDAAKSLPGLSQALLSAAALVASSRQELTRVQTQTAASLQSTYDVISALSKSSAAGTSSTTAILAAAATSANASTPSNASSANDETVSAVQDLKDEVVQLRADATAALAAVASYTNKTAKILDTVTAGSGGQAIAVANAA